jgi:hypothetical protein
MTTVASVILSEAKDLKMQRFRILRSFGVFAPQDDAASAEFSIRDWRTACSFHPREEAPHA